MARPVARVIVVSYNGAHLLGDCLDAIRGQAGVGPFEVVVVDNASTDGTPAWVADHYPEMEVVALATNTGFAGGVARALEDCAAPVAVLVNNDAVIEPGFLAAVLEPFRQPDVGAVCGKVLLAGSGRINSVGLEVTSDGFGRDRGWCEPDDGRYDTPTEVMGGSGAALALRMRAVEEAGGIDDSYFLYYEDLDLTWRMRLCGWSVVTAPDAVAHHEYSATVGHRSPLHAYYTERNRLITMVKDGTAGLAVIAVVQQPIRTAFAAVRELRSAGRERRRPQMAPIVARTRAFGGFARRLPSALRARRRIRARAVVGRAGLERRWLVSPK